MVYHKDQYLDLSYSLYIYINDLDEGLFNWILKFADDTKIFAKVSTADDHQHLQNDLDILMQWAMEWQMQFNVAKCKVMHIGRTNPCHQYLMNGQILESTDLERDLGVIHHLDLKASNQCKQAYGKASRMLGLIYRTIVNKTPSIMVRLYKTLVRPHVEYCAVAWSPHYIKDKQLIEKVQHRFTRMLPSLKSLPYEDRNRQLGLWTLEERRNRADVIEVYRMFHGQSSVSWQRFFDLNLDSRTRGHSYKLVKHRCNTLLRQHFFSERVITVWNALDADTVESSSLNSFKSCLLRQRNKQMDLFADLSST